MQRHVMVQLPMCVGNELWMNHHSAITLKKRMCSYSLRAAAHSEFGQSFKPEFGKVVTSELLWRAVKLPIYSVALVPLSVGSAVAYFTCLAFDLKQYCVLLLSSVLIVTWLNLSNDAYDAETGADKDKKESLVNITHSQKGVLMSAYGCLFLGWSGLVRASIVACDVKMLLLLASAITCGYVYQCPPFRLSYKGVGEPLCFLAFGPFATTAFYLSQSHASPTASLPLNWQIGGASFIVGITTTLILFCSHFHQIESDRAVGKTSPLVRLGSEKGAEIAKMGVVVAYGGVALLTLFKALPIPCLLLSVLTLPLAKVVVNFISNNHQNKNEIFKAKYYCVRLHAALGLALVMGFLAQAFTFLL